MTTKDNKFALELFVAKFYQLLKRTNRYEKNIP